ncbi:MAG: histidine kinase [Eubacteriales bacterium]|nr:histidine kinase [Eubacteriales bacterium]
MKEKKSALRKKAAMLRHSIQSKIFLAYGSIFLLLMILVSVVYYTTSYQNFLENRGHTSRQLSKIVSAQTEQYLDSLNSIQKRILESEEMLTYIFEGARQQNIVLDRAFRQNIYSITGYDLDFYHMNIYNMEDETLLTFGQNYDYRKYEISDQVRNNLINPVIDKSGALCLTALGQEVLYRPIEDVSTVSLLRAFGRYSLTTPKAVIEIQASYNKLESIISDLVLSYGSDEGQILIFNDNRELLYPQTFPQDSLDYYASLDTENQFLFTNPHTKKKEMVTSYHSSFLNLTTMLLTPESYLSSNRQLFLNASLGIFGISLLVLMLITYKIAKSVSSPLTQLKDRISALELDSISEEPQLPASSESFSEVEVLNKAYNRMQLRLKKSLDDIVASRTLSMHSQLMALQAQMDSHFLYNTLTIISIIAEENDDMQASAMCMKLTEMLRYITEDFAKESTFRQELHHCRNYTDLMSIRFGRKIDFVYETEEALLDVKVPRLILQPVVENCVKYSRRENTVLQVSIRTYIEEGWWKLEIKDNGDGFAAEALAGIQERISGLNEETAHSLSIDGLGLANIYLRLKLYYDNQFIFQLENRQDIENITGASITIGGPYHAF